MTKQEAKELTIEVWQYLADHPEIYSKIDLPDYLLKQITDCCNHCPLCQVILRRVDEDCINCPLESCDGDSLFMQWCYAYLAGDPIAVRREAAQGIVDAVKAWEPED